MEEDLIDQEYTITQPAFTYQIPKFVIEPSWCDIIYSFKITDPIGQYAVVFDANMEERIFTFFNDTGLNLAGALGTEVSIADLGANAINTAAGAQEAVEVVGRAIDDLQRARANIGTYQNRLDFAGQNLATTQENTESARSTLLDLDVAAEMTNFTSKQILVQSGVAMLAQANQMPQNLLRLLQ